MTEFMRSTDAFTWAMESDPRLRSTVVTVLLLEKSPDWDDVRDRIDLITRKLTAAFHPESLRVLDESDQHAGHAGHRPGGRAGEDI